MEKLTHNTIILIGKPQGERAFERSRNRWAGSQIKTKLSNGVVSYRFARFITHTKMTVIESSVM